MKAPRTLIELQRELSLASTYLHRRTFSNGILAHLRAEGPRGGHMYDVVAVRRPSGWHAAGVVFPGEVRP